MMMDRIIREVTDRYVNALPEQQEYYRIDDLRAGNIPEFVVQRMHIELEWNLGESMVLPKTDWANTASTGVKEAWRQFLAAIHAEARLPASYARAVIETAVTDIMEILVQPRKNIPDLVFSGEDTLSATELADRTELLVVYAHMARVLNGYVQRQNIDTLSRSECKKLVQRVDAKLIANYTPLQWAQMIDPLFTLVGAEVDSSLFRLFFEDKNMPRHARRFDLMNAAISRAELIEVLSSPKMLNFEGYEDDQSELFDEGEKGEHADEETQPSRTSAVGRAHDDADGDDQNSEPESVVEEKEAVNDEDDSEPVDDAVADDERDEPTAEMQVEQRESIVDSEPDEEDSDGGSAKPETAPPPKAEHTVDNDDDFDRGYETRPLNARASKTDKGPLIQRSEDDADGGEEDAEPASLNDQFWVDDEVDDDSTMPSPRNQAAENDDAAEELEAPIWMRFMDSEEADEPEEAPPSKEPDVAARDVGVSTLQQMFADEKQRFVRHLFNGSEQAYRRALEKIAAQKSWNAVGPVVKKEIFEKYNIDMYSDVAVDFIDKLQSHFINKT